MLGLQLYRKRDSGVFLLILQNFKEHLFSQNTSSGCFGATKMSEQLFNTSRLLLASSTILVQFSRKDLYSPFPVNLQAIGTYLFLIIW